MKMTIKALICSLAIGVAAPLYAALPADDESFDSDDALRKKDRLQKGEGDLEAGGTYFKPADHSEDRFKDYACCSDVESSQRDDSAEQRES